MTNKEFAIQLENRTRKFAVMIIRLSAMLPYTPEGKVIKYQLTKSATSIGANYREANRARSKADFRSKIRISESEASETVYWLNIISDMSWVKNMVIDENMVEANQILAIFTSISRRLKL